ncbi:diphthine methyltransferase [Chelonus insularis]|uniref:diphthine methyltransferase n=1 Tax=Chelonus insularis TaxID=460826 RepID=UPI00158AEC20|nr:diphthine methyltransferase [Chelonus insularis]
MFITLETFDTQFSADSVEWCPIEGFQDIFICGTYQLSPENEKSETVIDTKPQIRLGKIFLFQVIKVGKLKLLQELEVSGVLDIKWAHVRCQENILFGIVNSVGFLQIYKLHTDDDLKVELLTERKVREVEGEILALSLDWDTGKSPREGVKEEKISVSDSKGFVSIFHLIQGQLNFIGSQKAHEFEAWITAFDSWDSNIIYSGGDDCKFKRFDIREEMTLMKCNQVHEAGVTSLHSNSSQEFCLASGSYDEKLRLWDTRNFRRPVSEITLGGGVWRLKWDPFYNPHRYLLAACMYGGFRLIDCQNQENPKIIEEYNEHKSIAYGCDWCYFPSDQIIKKLQFEEYQKPVLVTTCSFYDHTLKLSVINFEE